MTLSDCNADTSVVRDLADEPALTAAELKAAFDGAANNIKSWLNGTHLPALNSALDSKQAALSLSASGAVFTDSDGKPAYKSYSQARVLLGLGESGALGIAYGGTGQTSAAAAMAALCEKGTFTPTIKGSTTAGTIAYQAQEGYYYRLGDYVYISIHIVTQSISGASGNVVVTSLPFTCVNTNTMLLTTSFSGNTQGYTSLNNGVIYGGNISLYCTITNGQYNGYLSFTGMDQISEIHVSGIYKIV